MKKNIETHINKSIALYFLPLYMIAQSLAVHATKIEVNENAVNGFFTVNNVVNDTSGLRDPKSLPVFGNVVRVDKVFGDDAKGARNGLPFLTINAALTAAQSGDTVWIFPGTYKESFVIPAGVIVHGLATDAVKITKQVNKNTDLVIMGNNSCLENVTLSLTSPKHVQLRGIVFPNNTAKNSHIKNVHLSVDNAQAGTGTSNVYGIHSNGTGQAGRETIAAHNCVITVNSTGFGFKRGILIDTANDFNAQNISVIVNNGIGIETNHANATCSIRASNISGASADISQTLGQITLFTTNLVHANANGLGFSTEIEPSILVWATAGALPAGTTYMKVGTETPTPNEMFVRISQPAIINALSIKARTSPGFSGQTPRVDTWTVRKNGIDQPLTVSLSGSQTENVNTSVSIPFNKGDSISLKVVRAPNSTTTEPTVVMDLY